MRTLITAIVTAVFTASVAVGITHSVMQEHERKAVDKVTVDAFNDGFLDAVCQNGVDGFGAKCFSR